MRIMLDINVLISYILFNNKMMNLFYDYILNNEQLILSNIIVDEIRKVFKRKFSDKICVLEKFISDLDIEIINIDKIEPNLFQIRDANDYPILYSAIKGNVDIFITGDNDFTDVDITKPKIMTIKQYITNFIL